MAASAVGRLNALIMGPPGGGKGTIAKKIIKDFGFFHLSTGDVLRAHVRGGTTIGKEAKSYMTKGALVPDELMVNLVVQELAENKGVTRLLLDGFPRTIPQAESLEKHVKIDVVVDLNIPDQTIIERISNRWIHAPSGRTYAYDYNPPKKHGHDDVTGEALVQREDDKAETVRARLLQYKNMTAPLIMFYRERGVLETFSGTESDVIYPHVREYLKMALTEKAFEESVRKHKQL